MTEKDRDLELDRSIHEALGNCIHKETVLKRKSFGKGFVYTKQYCAKCKIPVEDLSIPDYSTEEHSQALLRSLPEYRIAKWTSSVGEVHHVAIAAQPGSAQYPTYHQHGCQSLGRSIREAFARSKGIKV